MFFIRKSIVDNFTFRLVTFWVNYYRFHQPDFRKIRRVYRAGRRTAGQKLFVWVSLKRKFYFLQNYIFRFLRSYLPSLYNALIYKSVLLSGSCKILQANFEKQDEISSFKPSSDSNVFPLKLRCFFFSFWIKKSLNEKMLSWSKVGTLIGGLM